MTSERAAQNHTYLASSIVALALAVYGFWRFSDDVGRGFGLPGWALGMLALLASAACLTRYVVVRRRLAGGGEA